MSGCNGMGGDCDWMAGATQGVGHLSDEYAAAILEFITKYRLSLDDILYIIMMSGKLEKELDKDVLNELKKMATTYKKKMYKPKKPKE